MSVQLNGLLVCGPESVNGFDWFIRCGATCSDEEDSAESTTDEDNVEDNTCQDTTDERYIIARQCKLVWFSQTRVYTFGSCQTQLPGFDPGFGSQVNVLGSWHHVRPTMTI